MLRERCGFATRERDSAGLGPSLGGGLIGGLFGRAAGAVLGGAMEQLRKQQAEVIAAMPLYTMVLMLPSLKTLYLLTTCMLLVQAGELQQRALQAMQADARLQSRLGRSISLGYAGGCALSCCMTATCTEFLQPTLLFSLPKWMLALLTLPLLQAPPCSGDCHCMPALPSCSISGIWQLMRDACWAGHYC